MKQIPIDECPAGPEIDAAVARVCYGNNLVIDFEHKLIATSVDRLRESLQAGWIGWDNILKGEAESFCIKLPKYSTDIAAAWELVGLKKMAIIPLDNGLWAALPIGEMTTWKVNDDGKLGGYYETSLLYPYPDTGIADTVPLAITRAYLKTKGVEFVEVEE